MSNRNDLMTYLSKMEKYAGNTNKDKSEQIYKNDEKSNETNSLLIDKEKLFENFLMYINLKSSVNYE